MTFTPRWTPKAAATFESLRQAAERSRCSAGNKASKQEGLFKQVAKAVQLLCENPRHRGLQTHEFHSLEHPFDSGAKVFEAYAQNNTPGAYRVFWCYGPGRSEITIVAITPHP
jgi:hypothetical protein